MPSDYYSDAAPAPAAPEEAKPAPKGTTQDPAERAGEASTVIPKSALGGREVEVGDRCTFEVTHVTEDSVLAKYVSAEDKSEPEEAPMEEPPEEAEAAPPPSRFGALME